MSRPRLILLAGWTLFVIHAYPGLVSPETVIELGDARRHDFISGVEPASITALWAMLDFVIAGPFGMIAAASLTLLGGTYLLARRCGIAGRTAALVGAGVLLAPPVLAGTAIASGFALYAGLAALGCALVLADTRWQRGIGLALLALAAASRFGGAVGTLPLVLAMPLSGAAVRRVAIAVGLWAATIVVAVGLGWAVEDRDSGERARASEATSFAEALVRVPSPTSRDTQPLAALRELEVQTGYAAVQRASDAVVRGLHVAMVPIAYCVLALALLVWLRRDRILRALLASGLAIEASQFYVAGDGLYERSHWLVTTVAISGAIAIAIARKVRREPEPGVGP